MLKLNLNIGKYIFLSIYIAALTLFYFTVNNRYEISTSNSNCEVYSNQFIKYSETDYKKNEVTKLYFFKTGDEFVKFDISPIYLKTFNEIVKCTGKIYSYDLENQSILVGYNLIYFQFLKIAVFITNFLILKKIKISNIFISIALNLLSALLINNFFNFNFNFETDLKFRNQFLELLDPIIFSLILNNSKNSFNRFKIHKFTYTLIVIVLISRLLYLLNNNYFQLDVFEEWFINYNYGFIRRGMFGTLLLHLYNLSQLEISYFLSLLVISLYLILFWQLFKLIKKEIGLTEILVLLNPLFLTYNLFLKSTVILPKEILGYITLLIFINFQNKQSKIYLYWFFIFYTISIFSHEVNIFTLSTIFYICYFYEPSKLNKNIFNGLLFITTIFLCLIIFQDNVELTAETICSETYKKIYTDSNCLKSLTLVSNVKENINLVFKNIFLSKNQIFYTLTYLFSLILGFIPFLSDKWYINNKKFLFIILSFMIPLFLIGLDWGRWLNIMVFQISLYYLFKREKNILNDLKPITLVIAFILIYSSYWSVPQCCVTSYTFFSIFSHFSFNFVFGFILIKILNQKFKLLR